MVFAGGDEGLEEPGDTVVGCFEDRGKCEFFKEERFVYDMY